MYWERAYKYKTIQEGSTHPSFWQDFFQYYCTDAITRIQLDNIPVLLINVKDDLAIYMEGKLMYALFNKPDEVFDHARQALKEVYTIIDEQLEDIRIRFYNLPSIRKFRVVEAIDSRLIDKFIAIEGVVRKVSEPISVAKTLTLTCKKCGKKYVLRAKGRFIKKKTKCDLCGGKLAIESVERMNFQRIEIQDLPENLDAGEQPVLLEAYLTDDLVGEVKAGDKVVLNGILRGIERFKNVGNDMITADINYYFEVNSIEFLESDIRNITITAKDEQKIKELASRSDIYDLLVKSVAPSIYGYEDIKLAIILALVGGCTMTRKDGTRVRGDIHILLVGDPAMGKSQLLRSVQSIAPRVVSTTGYSSTGAGLTVTVTKDENNRWTMEAGALVLADRGVALIDELEKMGKEDRKYVLEALEQQTITVAKAGINATLNARCTVIAGANPKLGRFNKYEPLVEQIDLEPPLLSRFDLIFIIVDEPNEARDERIADFILSNIDDDRDPAIDPELLRKFVYYVRTKIDRVKLSDEAKKIIKEFYKKLRKESNDSIAVTTRQLEALIRMTQASAKVQLRNIATAEDALRAINLFKRSLEQIAVDPETGKFDIDYAFTGISASMRDQMAVVKELIKELQDSTKYGAHEGDVIRVAEERGVMNVHKILEKLKEEGEIYSPRPGYFRVFNS